MMVRNPARIASCERHLNIVCTAAVGDFAALIETTPVTVYDLNRAWLNYLEGLLDRATVLGASVLTSAERAGIASLLLSIVIGRPMHVTAEHFDRLVVPTDLQHLLVTVRDARTSIGAIFRVVNALSGSLPNLPLRERCVDIWVRAVTRLGATTDAESAGAAALESATPPDAPKC